MATKEEIFSKVSSSIEIIRPYLQNDGGDISLVDITDDLTVRVKLHGACGSCPYSLRSEEHTSELHPEIKEVIAVDMA